MTKPPKKTKARATPTRAARPNRNADPVLVAIADYKHAVALWAADLYANDENVSQELADAQWTAFDALFTTQPTTLVGLAALLDLFGSDPYEQGREDCELTLEWALARENAARKFVGNTFKAMAAMARALDAEILLKHNYSPALTSPCTPHD